MTRSFIYSAEIAGLAFLIIIRADVFILRMAFSTRSCSTISAFVTTSSTRTAGCIVAIYCANYWYECSISAGSTDMCSFIETKIRFAGKAGGI